MRYVLLTSLLCLSTFSYADETNVDLSGYAYATFFQDKDWFGHEYKAAINADITKGNLALRGQISSAGKQPRRLSAEYQHSATENTSVRYQIGRIVRLDGFYDHVTDSPASTGMSVLPLSTYNRKMNEGTYTLIDGIQINGITRKDDTLVDYGIRFGKAFIESEDELQIEALGRVVSPNIKTDPKFNNYDLYVKYYHKDITALFSINHYSTGMKNVDPRDPVAGYIVSQAANIHYDTAKIGLMKKMDKWEFSSEYHYGITRSKDRSDKTTTRKVAHNSYIKVGYDITDSCQIYTAYAYGKLELSPSMAKDFTVGALWDIGTWMINLEYHTGKQTGRAWTKYDAPIGKKNWDSFVLSIVKRF